MSGIFNAEIFNNAIFNTGESAVVTGGGGGRGRLKRPKRKRETVLRWKDYETAEERRLALAQALANSSQPIAAMPLGDDEDDEDEDALITALVLSRIIH